MTETIRDQRKLHRVVIKEELVALTGDWRKALILNQLLYWSERTRDFDKFLAEERERDPDASVELTHGWIYKAAGELCKELMIGVSDASILRDLDALIEAGWLDRRHNPHHKWDRTWQYRPNILNIQIDLHDLGYALDDYPLVTDAFPTVENGIDTVQDRNQPGGDAIPETTTETLTEIQSADENGNPPDHLDLASHTHAIREQRKAEGKAPSFSEGDGVSENLFHSAPLVAFCRLLPCDPADLPADKCASWERELRTLATDNETTPAELAAALAGLKADGSAYAWKTYSTPFSDGFQGDVTAVLAIRRGEARAGKIPGNGRGPPQPTGPPIVISGLDETPEWLRG